MEQSQRTGDFVHDCITRYKDTVYRLAYARTGSKQDADDIFQDVFMKLFTSNPSFESEEHLKAWLIRTTVHTSINLLKSAWRRYTCSDGAGEAAHKQCASGGRHDEIQAALKKLPEKYRVAIYLHYYENYSTDEIAAFMNIKPGTVRSLLSRGRDRLKLMIEESEGSET